MRSDAAGDSTPTSEGTHGGRGGRGGSGGDEARGGGGAGAGGASSKSRGGGGRGGGPGSKLVVIQEPMGWDIVARYELGRELGHSEFGVTYLYTDHATRDALAYKSISKKFIFLNLSPFDGALVSMFDETFRKRFFIEGGVGTEH
jgi:hypothetical protein